MSETIDSLGMSAYAEILGVEQQLEQIGFVFNKSRYYSASNRPIFSVIPKPGCHLLLSRKPVFEGTLGELRGFIAAWTASKHYYLNLFDHSMSDVDDKEKSIRNKELLGQIKND